MPPSPPPPCRWVSQLRRAHACNTPALIRGSVVSTIGRGEILIDLPAQIPGEEALDGMKADIKGNLYLSAPGGVWIFDASGKHLGTVTAPHPVRNFAWAGSDGRTLYLCARSALYRIDLLIPGIRP
jgi:gluconolactonase